MNRLHVGLGLGFTWLVTTGCVANSKEIGATASTTMMMTSATGDSTDSSSEGSGSMTSTSASSDPTDTSGSSGTTGTTDAETTTGQPHTCQEAQNESQCGMVDAEFELCGWVPTLVYAFGACDPIETGLEGECVLLSQDDTCSPAADSTCPDGETRVYFRELGLEIGAIEIVAFDSSFECEESSMGFEPCVMIEGDPVTYDPPECACGCPG